MTESIVSVVIERLGILLIEESEIFQGVSNHVNEVLAELRKIEDSLKDADLGQDKRDLPYAIRTWLADARKLAYDAEDLLEGFVLNRRLGGGIKSILKRYVCILDESTGLDRLGRQIQSIKAKISVLLTRLPSFESRNLKLKVDESLSSAHEIIMPKELTRFYNHVVGEPEIVGFKEDVEVLLEHLVNDRDRVVTIHGMGGLGKTTLAQKIYNHTSIKRHFTCLAWVSISQKWETQYVLQKILLQLVQDPERKEAILQLTIEQLQKEIFGVYQNKKCLVVLDDIWSNDSWKDLNAAFSTGGHGVKSKLLLTTRNVEVAKHVDSKGFFHQLRLLTKGESWKLLYEKAFPKNDLIGLNTLQNLRQLSCTEVRNIEILEYLVNNVISNSNLRYSSFQILNCDLDSERGATLLKQALMGDEYLCSSNIHNLVIKGPIAILPCDDKVRGFSSSLTELSLTGSNLKEDPMTTLEKYPNLRFLHLGYNAYLGKKMVCSSTGFPKLKTLHLQSLSNLEEWRLDQGGIPKLLFLYVYACKRMKMLPDGLRFLTLLQELNIAKMPKEFCDRVRVVDDATTDAQDFYKVRHVSRIDIG